MADEKRVLSQNISLAIVFVAIVVIALLVTMLIFPPEQPYKYTVSRNGVAFLSNEANPSELLSELKSEYAFVVSPEVVEQGTINQYMTQSLTLFSALLTSKGKTVISLPRLVDDSHSILSCQTNDGNRYVARKITAEECLEKLSDSSVAVIKIDLPDDSLSQPQIILESNNIWIKPKTYSDVSSTSFTLLEGMYADSAETIDLFNRILQGLG